MCDDVDRCTGYLLCSSGRRKRRVVQQEKFLLRTCAQVLHPESDMLCPESVLRAETDMLRPKEVLPSS